MAGHYDTARPVEHRCQWVTAARQRAYSRRVGADRLAATAPPSTHRDRCVTEGARRRTTVAKDQLRIGWYSDQTTLTPGLVSGGTFIPQFAAPVDGQVYAQPLVANNNVLMATETNNIYGLDPGNGSQRGAATSAPRGTRPTSDAPTQPRASASPARRS
jgi:hypothetical protein